MFRNKRALVFLALVVVVIMTLMAPMTLAKSGNAPMGKSGGSDPSTAIVNATKMLGRAYLFYEAAIYFNEQGPAIYGQNYNFSTDYWREIYLLPLQDRLGAMIELSATDPAAAEILARQIFIEAEAIKTQIETCIHGPLDAYGNPLNPRSVGEFKHKSDIKVLIFGTDTWTCLPASFMLAKAGIEHDVVLQNFLTNLDMKQYDAMIFDPEYNWYGCLAGGGAQTGWNDLGLRYPWMYGGLSPADNILLEELVDTGKLGLIYMEPKYNYPEFGVHDVEGKEWTTTYCEYGQIPFLTVQMRFPEDWDYGYKWTYYDVVSGSTHPIAEGMPASFGVQTSGQWNSIDVLDTPDDKITNKEVVFTATGPGVIGFNYGAGRIALLGMDTFLSGDNNNLGKLIENSTRWASNR